MNRRLIPHIQQRIEAQIAKTLRENSLEPKPKERIAMTNQKALLNADPMRILTGDIEVYDNRERQPR
jgi:hypothetical protein